MRKKHPEINDTRIIKKFLLFPKRIEYETRWLEVASWEEKFTLYYLPHVLSHGSAFWDSIKWVENDITT